MRHRFARVFVVCSMVVAFAGAATAQENKTIPGIGPVGAVTRAHTGFTFTEGPAADADGNVYFSDVRENRIHKVGTAGDLSTWLENSDGCNGLMFDVRGRLTACQGAAGRVVAFDLPSKKLTVLAAGYAGKPFNKPNDLVVDSHGGVYFTDPSPAGTTDMLQDKMGVYYASADGQVTRLIDDLQRPNGTILSPDEKTLYVLPAATPVVMAYPVEAPGKLGKGRVLIETAQAASPMPRGGDGLTVDAKGNLYVTQPGISAIQVISPDGKSLGLIYFPEGPSNCTFGGADMKTLFVTARSSLYTVPMEATGHRFAQRQE